MVGTQECSVVCAGGAAAGPVVDVVGFAPGCGDGAAGEGAALVPGGDGFADVRREEPGGAADVQDPALVAEEDGDDVGVAGDLADGRGGDGPGEGEGAGAGEPERASCGGAPSGCFTGPVGAVGLRGVGEPVEEVAVVDGDHDLGAESARGGQPAGSEGDFAAPDEPV